MLIRINEMIEHYQEIASKNHFDRKDKELLINDILSDLEEIKNMIEKDSNPPATYYYCDNCYSGEEDEE